MKPNVAIGSYGMRPLASIYINKMYIYSQKHVYMATYSHVHPYIQYIYTQMVHQMTFQCINSQEADAHYTKLTKLQCNNTQLPRGGL